MSFCSRIVSRELALKFAINQALIDGSNWSITGAFSDEILMTKQSVKPYLPMSALE
jgi:hypothetical protein